MSGLLVKYLVFFLFMAVGPKQVAFGSAICGSGNRNFDGQGTWLLKPRANAQIDRIELILEKTTTLFKGKMVIHKKKGVQETLKIQICEGDCCNEFSDQFVSVNFWQVNKSDFSNKGRVTLQGKVDWKTKTLSGKIHTSSFTREIAVAGKKL